MYTSKNWSN